MEQPSSMPRPTLPGTPRGGLEPAYARLVRTLSEEIAAGVHRPGDRLPSEAQLRARFEVSGMTVRRAINILVDRGLVTASQGKGTFVRGLDMSDALFSLRERRPPADDAGRREIEREVQLLGASIRPADEAVAGHLAVEPDTSVVYLKRLGLHEGEPVLCNREYLVYDPRRAVVEAELQINSLEGLFRSELGHGLRRGDLTMEAVAVDEEEAELLSVTPGTPGLRLEHRLFDFADQPMAWGWFTFRSDRFHLVSRIGPDQGDLGTREVL